MGKTLFQMSRVRSTTDVENSAGSSFAEVLPFQSSLWHRHDGSSESVGSRKPNPNFCTLSVMGHVTTREHAGHDSYRDFFHIARVLAQTHDDMEVLVMDQGTEFGADFQHLCQSRGILPVVTDLETPWQNSVVERHGALFKNGIRESVQSGSSDDGR